MSFIDFTAHDYTFTLSPFQLHLPIRTVNRVCVTPAASEGHRSHELLP